MSDILHRLDLEESGLVMDTSAPSEAGNWGENEWTTIHVNNMKRQDSGYFTYTYCMKQYESYTKEVPGPISIGK